MISKQPFRIASLPGDGIGVEVVDATIAVMTAITRRFPAAAMRFEHHDAGAAHFLLSGTGLPESTLAACGEADAIFLGAMGLPDVRTAEGTEISPQLDIRDHFGLYAGVRPIRSFTGLPVVLADPRASEIDMVLVREQTEGLFYKRGKARIENGTAFDTMAISEVGTRRVSRFAFELAARRGARAGAAKPRVTIVDKANVLGSMAYFRELFLDVAKTYPQIDADCAYIDATALNLVRRPWSFDVMVTENQFGDILSDLCAALIGGMGLAPSADIGETHAMFQPAHGSAPDIAGKGIANPTASILSAAMMLEWLGATRQQPELAAAALAIDQATRAAFAEGKLIPAEFGGNADTDQITAAIVRNIDASA